MQGKLIDFSMNMIYQVALQATVFLLFFIFVKKFFYDKVLDIINKRKTLIDEEFERADEANTQALNYKNEYEQKLDTFKEDVSKQREKIIFDANKEKEAIISDAKTEKEQLLKRTEKEIKSSKINAKKEIKDDIVEISFDIVKEVLNEKIAKENEDEILKDIIKNLDKI